MHTDPCICKLPPVSFLIPSKMVPILEGSAKPDASIKRYSKSRCDISIKLSTNLSLMQAQKIEPLDNSESAIPSSPSSFASIFSLPKSFTMTPAFMLLPYSHRIFCIRVVLPEPKKPVIIIIFIRLTSQKRNTSVSTDDVSLFFCKKNLPEESKCSPRIGKRLYFIFCTI